MLDMLHEEEPADESPLNEIKVEF